MQSKGIEKGAPEPWLRGGGRSILFFLLSLNLGHEHQKKLLKQNSIDTNLLRLPVGPGHGADRDGAPACHGSGRARGLGEGALHCFEKGRERRGERRKGKR